MRCGRRRRRRRAPSRIDCPTPFPGDPMTPIRCLSVLLAGLALLPLAQAADPAPIQRHRPAGSTFPIASAVEVPAGRSLVYLSGVVPPVVDDKAERGSLAAYGDTR